MTNRQNILLFDTRYERPLKYKRFLENKMHVMVNIVKDYDEFEDYCKKLLPDLILISDSIKEDTASVCQKIRKKQIDNPVFLGGGRPVLVVLSKSSHSADKILNFEKGADDFLSEPIDFEEFTSRIMAHLRRLEEENTDFITGAHNKNSLMKTLKRTFNVGENWALLMVDIDNFSTYKEVYGEIASNKMLQTYTAIMNATFCDKDFLGLIEDDKFIIVTKTYQSVKMANLLKFAFDKVSSRFYNDEDLARGYITTTSENQTGKRTPLVSTSIGIVDSDIKKYFSLEEVLYNLISAHKLAKMQMGSSIVKDALMLSSAQEVSKDENNRVLVVEEDAATACLVVMTLDMQGYQTQAMSNYKNVLSYVEKFSPNIVIIDAGDDDRGLDVCAQIKELQKEKTKVIVTSVMHNKKVALEKGADLYLPKPYDIFDLHIWVKKFLR